MRRVRHSGMRGVRSPPLRDLTSVLPLGAEEGVHGVQALLPVPDGVETPRHTLTELKGRERRRKGRIQRVRVRGDLRGRAVFVDLVRDDREIVERPGSEDWPGRGVSTRRADTGAGVRRSPLALPHGQRTTHM